MAQTVPLSTYAKRVAIALDHLQLALDNETTILYTREHSQPWKTLRHEADAAWDNVLTELSQIAAAASLGPDEARLAVLCDRNRRYLEGVDIDPTLWKLALAGLRRNQWPFDKMIRRGVRLTNDYARLLNIDAFAA